MPETVKDAPARQDRRKARTRLALIQAAQGFLAAGQSAVSIQEITERADVGFGSFYNHFASKDELFEAAVTATLQSWAEVRDVLVADMDDPAEVFAASFRLSGRLQRVVPEQVRVLLHHGTGILNHDEGLAPRALRDLEAATAAGRFDLEDSYLGLMAVGGALLGLMQLLDSNPEADAADASDQFTERMLRALGMDAEEAHRVAHLSLPEMPDFL